MVKTIAKGRRTSWKAENELRQAGWTVYHIPHTRFSKDMFGLFDAVAVKSKYKKWLQWKTNRIPPLKPYLQFKLKHCNKYDSVEIWVWYDRQGFKKIKV